MKSFAFTRASCYLTNVYNPVKLKINVKLYLNVNRSLKEQETKIFGEVNERVRESYVGESRA